MPNYDYKCEPCDKQEMIFRYLADYDKPVPCPDCGKEMIRLISAGGFVLNGPGWHKFEYTKTGRKKGM